MIKPEIRSAVTSNTFNFTFGASDSLEGTGPAARKGGGGPILRRVLPATHEEAYRIMARYKADLVQLQEDEAAAQQVPKL